MSDLVHNERIKLTCAWLNGIAGGAVTAGAIAPLVAAFYGVSNASARNLGIGVGIWFFAGVSLHFIARRILGSLKP